MTLLRVIGRERLLIIHATSASPVWVAISFHRSSLIRAPWPSTCPDGGKFGLSTVRMSRGTLTVRHLSPWARLREPLGEPGGIGRNPGTGELPGRARREQEFGYEVEVVEGEVNAASVVDPSQSIAAAVY
jgi:hypothetical protein